MTIFAGAGAARPPAKDGGGTARLSRLPVGQLLWLGYLALYFTPWVFDRPGAAEVAAGLAGTAAFLAIYGHGLRPRRSYLLHALACSGIGFALSPFGGAWSVFNVFGMGFAARAQPRRVAVSGLVGLMAVLAAFGLLSRQPWLAWASGEFFGAMIGLATLLRSELEEKNRRLEQAQGEVRVLAAAAERERISRDLHDLLGHTLTVVAVKAELAERLCERDPDAARQEMHDLAAIARDALSQVRTAVVGMQEASLQVEIARAERALLAAGVRAEVGGGLAVEDPRREAILAMALREAVTNVIRHADAGLCTLRVEEDAQGGIELSVEDDGGGGTVQEGSGLAGMRARLEAAGGALRLQRGRYGLRLVASLPAAEGARA